MSIDGSCLPPQCYTFTYTCTCTCTCSYYNYFIFVPAVADVCPSH